MFKTILAYIYMYISMQRKGELVLNHEPLSRKQSNAFNMFVGSCAAWNVAAVLGCQFKSNLLAEGLELAVIPSVSFHEICFIRKDRYHMWFPVEHINDVFLHANQEIHVSHEELGAWKACLMLLPLIARIYADKICQSLFSH